MDGTRRNWLCRVPPTGTRRNLVFAECRPCSTRQKLMAVSHPEGRRTADARAGHVSRLCRVLARWHSAKARYAECLSLPTGRTRQSFGMPCATSLPSARCLALGKAHICRVPVVWHSAKPETLGICAFSGSALASEVSCVYGGSHQPPPGHEAFT